MNPSVAALGLSAVLAARSAFAQDLPVRLEGALDTAAAMRVREELSALGRTPTSPSSPSAAPGVTVDLAGEGSAALHAVVTDPSGAHQTVEVSRATVDAIAVFALRVVEAVQQASLVRRRLPETPVPAAPRWFLGLDAAVTFAPGGVGPELHPRLRAGYGDRWAVHVVLGVPGFGGAIEGPGVSARLSAFEAGVGATTAVLRGASARVDVGLRTSWMLLSGALSQGEGQAFDQTSTVALFGLVSSAGRLVGGFGWRAEIAWGAALSPLVVRIDDRLVAQWGRPLVVASAGVSLGL